MYAEHAMLILDDQPVALVRALLAAMSGDDRVVIRRAGSRGGPHHVFAVSELVALVQEASDDTELGEALGLEHLPPNALVSEPVGDSPVRPGDVIDLGGGAVGVVVAGGGRRRGGGTLWAAGVSPPGNPSTGSRRPRPAGPRPAELESLHPAPSSPEDSGGRVAGGGGGAPTEGPPAMLGAPARFRAFPRLEGPRAVTVGARFTVSVGFDPDAPSTADAQPVIVPGAPPVLSFALQVAGFGLEFPDGVRQVLRVDRDAPELARAEFSVEAGPVRRQATRTVEVSFEYEGELVGRAWLDVSVGVAGGARTVVGQPETGSSGGTGVQLALEADAPDLTVEIRSDGGSDLEWVFHTAHDVPRPETRVVTRLEAASAEAFAVQLMAQLPLTKGSPELYPRVRGMGESVNRVLPEEFWALVEATWRAVGPGTTPSMLITTSEPFVPWELAWVSEDWVAPDVLPAGVTQGPLGGLWRIGRWVPPRRVRRGPDRPAAPPEHVIDVRTIAVVVGDYSGDPKVRNLPFAIEEGRDLVEEARALDLGAVSLAATDDEVARLLNPPTGDGTGTCQALHVAAHGQVSTQQAQYTGILLAGGRRLDLLAVEGSTIGRVSRPLVFLNACQVGTAGRLLSTYGGLAGAFIGTGCRGFLAPLWNVDDDVAKALALGFYQDTLHEGVTVGEAVRRMREGFGTGEGGSATPLAYVFYGHPNLRLRRAADLDGHGSDDAGRGSGGDDQDTARGG